MPPVPTPNTFVTTVEIDQNDPVVTYQLLYADGNPIPTAQRLVPDCRPPGVAVTEDGNGTKGLAYVNADGSYGLYHVSQERPA